MGENRFWPIMNLKLTIALCVVFLGVTQAYNCTYGLVAGKEAYECNACKGPTAAIPTVETREEKSQLVALLLQIFLGNLGVGPFYYGDAGLGAGLLCLFLGPCLIACCAQIFLGVKLGAGGGDGGEGGGALVTCVSCIVCLACCAGFILGIVYIILIATAGFRPDE